MRSRTAKVLHPLCGRPMIDYVLDAADGVTGQRPLVVYSPATAALVDVVADRADLALQPEPRGTGDAVRAAIDALVDAGVPSDEGDEILVLSGDVPRLQSRTLLELLDARRMDAAVMTLVAVDAIDPSGLGRVIRTPAGSVDRIVEEKDATDEERLVAEINAGLYAFDAQWLRSRIGDLRPSAATGELYLTELVALARQEGRLVTAIDVEDDGRLTGINDRSQLAQAEWDLRTELNLEHMQAGVTMVDPSTVYLEPTVELSPDVVLGPNVILKGATRVGEGTTIDAGSQLIDTVVGRDCHVWSSVLERSTVGDRVRVGPFSHLRPGCVIDDDAEIGNYAELKNTHIGPGVKSHHVSYLGDAELGARTNVGAGTITANYDGIRKHRTTIGEGVFLGVDTMLRAPITLGDGARTGAGAVVTHDVPAGALVVGIPARVRSGDGAPTDAAQPTSDRVPSAADADPPPSAAEAGASAARSDPPPRGRRRS
jgi:bifunctional UDP-N-acetylglucosamine pyrophosphorylase/glucosamine-1-phosphate N-acetyltransferase